MTDKAPELEIRLLLLRYGRRKILEALAHLEDQSVDEIERELSAAERKPKRKRTAASSLDIVAAETQKRPEVSEQLQTLASLFEARVFLPQLRDVQRFLERAGTSVRKPKSRAAVMSVLFRTLAKMEPHELNALIAGLHTQGDSDFSLLARTIMGTSRQ